MKKIILILTVITLMFISSCSTENNLSLNNSKQIVALGDSLTEGYGLNNEESYPSQLEKLLKEKGYDYEIINGGVNGNTSEQLLNRISDYDDIKADIYLLNIGANDGLRKKNLDKMQKNIEYIINYLKEKNPNGKIILFGVKLLFHLGFSYSRDFNSRFEKIAEKNDLYYFGNFLEDINGVKELNLNDWLHPNKKGYKIISDKILYFLKENNFIEKNSK